MPNQHSSDLLENPIPGLDDVPRPVIWQPSERARDEIVTPHFHRRAQLLYAANGIMTVITEDGIWVVPPHRAVWIPPGMAHSIHANTPLSLRNLYFDPAAIPDLPERLSVVAVPALLRELILEAFTLPPLYDEAGPAGRLLRVLVDRIRTLDDVPLNLSLPSSRPARQIADGIVSEPADNRSLEAWAKKVGSSARTLARQFPAETGMTFGQWRQQARLLEALRLLADGAPVTTIALDLGYANQSAFIAMFRKALGKTPGKYFG